jgi:putative alpha-1,2-mannosidase
MAKAVADVKGENQGGFGSDYSKIQGFSQMHDLGVGWVNRILSLCKFGMANPSQVASLGNFPIMPYPGCPDDDLDKCFFSKFERSVHSVNGSVVARPGYFAVGLESGVNAEMTVTDHVALYRFKFGARGTRIVTPSPIIATFLEDLQGSARQNLIHIDPKTGRVTGNATFSPSFGSGWYIGYLCVDFAGGELRDMAYLQSDGKLLVPDSQQEGQFYGARIRFHPTDEILVRVGLSFISNEHACRNAEKEIPNFDFEATLAAAEKEWEEKMSVISVDPTRADEELLTVFWTGIYRTFISPQNYTGENPMWTSDEPYFDSWYCIWDTFRTTHPLLTLLDQNVRFWPVLPIVLIHSLLTQ